jgi:probable HAF family extracellular repeat protein
MPRALLSAVLSLSVLFSTLVAAQAAEYTFATIDIPSEGGNNAAIAFAINNTGQVVGYYNTAYPDPAGTRGFYTTTGRLPRCTTRTRRRAPSRWASMMPCRSWGAMMTA